MTGASTAGTRSSARRRPAGLWSAVAWSWRRGVEGGGVSRARRVTRTLHANLVHGRALQRWMQAVFDAHQRGIVSDVEGEYLRAVRPSVHRFTDVGARVSQLIDHNDWLEAAFKPKALERLNANAARHAEHMGDKAPKKTDLGSG